MVISRVKRWWAALTALRTIPLDPFDEVDDEARHLALQDMGDDQKQEVAQRLTNRYNMRTASSSNTHVANAFVFGAEIALVLGICGFMLGTSHKGLRLAYLPAFWLSIFAVGLLVAGVIRARSMGSPSHKRDELLEVIEQVKAGQAAEKAAYESASRSMKQRLRLHLNDLFGTWSMYALQATLVAFAVGATINVVGSFVVDP